MLINIVLTGQSLVVGFDLVIQLIGEFQIIIYLFYKAIYAVQVDILTGRVHKEKISLTLSSILSNLEN